MTEQELSKLISRIGLRGALLSGAFEQTVGEDVGSAVNAAKNEINATMQAALKNVSSSEKTNVLTKNLFSRQDKETLTVVHTTNVVMELESHFTGFRVGIHNIHTAAVQGVRVCVSVRDKLDYAGSDAAWATEYTTSGSDWYDATFDGSASGTLAPQIAEERPSTTWTDIIPLKSLTRTDGGSRPVVMVRIQLPSGAIMSRPFNQIYNWRTAGPRYYKTSKAAVAGVDNKTSYTQLANTEAGTINPAIMYYSVKSGRQLLLVGDSTVEGIGGTPTCYGASQMAAYETSTPDNPVEYYNAALHAQVPLTYTPRIQDLLSVVNPTHLFYSSWSGNDVSVGGISEDALKRSQQALSLAMTYIANYKAPLKVVLAEGLPTTVAGRNTGAGDAKRVTYNTWIGTFSGYAPATGYAASVTSGQDSSGQMLLDTTLTGDNVHPNVAGYTKLKQVIKPLLFGT